MPMITVIERLRVYAITQGEDQQILGLGASLYERLLPEDDFDSSTTGESSADVC